LEERIVNNLDLYTKMVSESMQQPSTWNVGRIVFYLILIVTFDLLVNHFFVKCLALLISDEE
jgi:hypothetical protein